MRLTPGVASFCLLVATLARAELRLSFTIPQQFGVNIHFTDPQPGEMKMLAEAGFRFIRMDLDWARTEKARGVYDFAPYERLLGALDEHGIRAVLILDYANPLYDDNRSPDTDEGRAAFAKWAAAAVTKFKDRGVLWEMYNEPNITPFWRPKPDVENYIKLAIETGKAIRAAAPGEAYIGPAVSGIDLPFLEACFNAGLLEYWDAVSVHPYRQVDPESAEEDYRNLRLLIAKYAPHGKTIPILSGEWGYSAAWAGVDEDRQAKLLARQWLFNLSQDVQLSIWYDWRNDGTDPKEAEHHFGTVRHEHQMGREPAFEPKPAYLIARALTSELRGFKFSKRIALEDPSDFMLLFEKDGQARVVAWTRSRQSKSALLPMSAGQINVTSHLGERVAQMTAGNAGLRIDLTEAPVYLTPEEPNDLLRLALAWQRAPLEVVARPEKGGVRVALSCTNPLTDELRVSTSASGGTTAAQSGTIPAKGTESGSVWLAVDRFARQQRRTIGWGFGSVGSLSQDTTLVVENAMTLMVLPRCGRYLPVRLENPSGEPFDGRIAVDYGADAAGTEDELRLRPGQRDLTLLRFAPPGREYHVRVAVTDAAAPPGSKPVELKHGFVPIALDEGKFEVSAGGDAKVASTQTASLAAAPDGLPAPGWSAIKLDYHFDAGWKYACLSPNPQPILAGQTGAHLGMWVHGDGSGNILRMRFIDKTDETFQPDGRKLDFTGWRYVTFPLDGTKAGHWGGAKDGVVHHPIRLETLLLIDSADRQKTAGTVYVSCPTVVYRE